jgi:hypothetical protein
VFSRQTPRYVRAKQVDKPAVLTPPTKGKAAVAVPVDPGALAVEVGATVVVGDDAPGRHCE